VSRAASPRRSRPILVANRRGGQIARRSPPVGAPTPKACGRTAGKSACGSQLRGNPAG